MKPQAIILSVLFSLLLTWPASGRQQVAVPLSNPGNPGQLDLSLVMGAIHVSGYDGDEVVIRYRNDPGNDLEEIAETVSRALTGALGKSMEALHDSSENANEAQEGLRKISGNSVAFDVNENNNLVEINNVSPLKSIRFDILVPRNFSLKLDLVLGDDISIENVNGEMEVSHVNGSVHLTGVEGSAVINTVNGNITATFLGLTEDKPMAASTVNGNIDITLPAGAQLSAKMNSEWGDVFTDFTMEVQPVATDVTSGSGSRNVSVDRWIQGDINGGGPEYLFKTLNGNIYIRKR